MMANWIRHAIGGMNRNGDGLGICCSLAEVERLISAGEWDITTNNCVLRQKVEDLIVGCN